MFELRWFLLLSLTVEAHLPVMLPPVPRLLLRPIDAVLCMLVLYFYTVA